MVSLGTFDGLDALILEQEYDGASYFTYIYTDEHELKELFVKKAYRLMPPGQADPAGKVL